MRTWIGKISAAIVVMSLVACASGGRDPAYDRIPNYDPGYRWPGYDSTIIIDRDRPRCSRPHVSPMVAPSA